MDDIKCLLKISLMQKRAGVGKRVHLNGKAFLKPCLNLLIFRLTGARPSIFFNRSKMGLKKFSYFGASRMSSIPNVTTASTPFSPTHCGVISLGKFL